MAPVVFTPASTSKAPHASLFAYFQSLISNKDLRGTHSCTYRAINMWPFLIQKFDTGFLGVSLGMAFDRPLNLFHEDSFLLYLWIL